MTPWVMQIPVLSSAHLSFRTTRGLVEGKYSAALVAPYNAGMFIWVGCEDLTSFPRDFKLLAKWARSQNHEWVRLDSIGEITMKLPIYSDWK